MGAGASPKCERTNPSLHCTRQLWPVCQWCTVGRDRSEFLGNKNTLIRHVGHRAGFRGADTCVSIFHFLPTSSHTAGRHPGQQLCFHSHTEAFLERTVAFVSSIFHLAFILGGGGGEGRGGEIPRCCTVIRKWTSSFPRGKKKKKFIWQWSNGWVTRQVKASADVVRRSHFEVNARNSQDLILKTLLSLKDLT